MAAGSRIGPSSVPETCGGALVKPERQADIVPLETEPQPALKLLDIRSGSSHVEPATELSVEIHVRRLGIEGRGSEQDLVGGLTPFKIDVAPQWPCSRRRHHLKLPAQHRPAQIPSSPGGLEMSMSRGASVPCGGNEIEQWTDSLHTGALDGSGDFPAAPSPASRRCRQTSRPSIAARSPPQRIPWRPRSQRPSAEGTRACRPTITKSRSLA